MGRLEELDLSLRLPRKEQDARLETGQERMAELRLALAGKLDSTDLGPPVCVLFEGWDASGKGGAIKRLVAAMDSRHVRVAQFSAPTPDEKRHHFLWRFWPKLPGWGGMAVFDRSWYGRVLVERVEDYATDLSLDQIARRVASSRRQLQRAYSEIGNTTFREHLTRVRMQRAADMLATRGLTVREVARRVGYRQPAQFAKAFRRYQGVAPSAFRLNGAGTSRNGSGILATGPAVYGGERQAA